MKQRMQILLLSSIIAVVESTALKGFKAPRLSMLRTLNSNDACELDNEVLADVDEFSQIMNQVEADFNADFQEHNDEYCVNRKEGTTTYKACLADYSKFNDDYVVQCDTSGGSFYPVSIFMICKGDTDSGFLELEMELMNIPSCFGITCKVDEIYESLLGGLRATDASVSGADNGLACSFYHDYDSLEGSTPNTIKVQGPDTNQDYNTTSTAATVTNTGFAVFTIIIGLLLTL